MLRVFISESDDYLFECSMWITWDCNDLYLKVWFFQSLRSNFRTKVVAFTYITVFFSKSIDYWVFNWKLSIVVEYKLINVWLPLLGRFHFISFERESSGILYKIPTSHVFWSAHVKNLWVTSERSIQLHVQIYPQLRILLSGRVLHKNGLDSFPVMFI